jgi:hypothetical protein
MLRAGIQAIAGGYAVFFTVVALAKLDAWRSWSAAVSQWLPDGLSVQATRIALPSLEALTVAVLLLSPPLGLLLSAVLLAAFGAGVLLLSRQARGKECGCYGALLPSRIGGALAARNLILAGVAVGACLLAWRSAAPGPRAPVILLLALLSALLMLSAEARRVTRMVRDASRDQGEAA